MSATAIQTKKMIESNMIWLLKSMRHKGNEPRTEGQPSKVAEACLEQLAYGCEDAGTFETTASTSASSPG